MITNKPAPGEFKNLSVQYLAQSVDLLLKTEMTITQGDWETDEELEEQWRNRQGILGNSLIMLFLSIENYFKYKICKVDPLLLIAGEPSRWGLSKGDKNFEDLFIHQFDDLLVIYQEITEEEISSDVKQKLNELRKKRNKYTHGLHRDILMPNYIIKSVSIFLTSLWEEDWTRDFKSVMLTEPLYGLTTEEEEQMMLLYYFKIFEKYLTENELRRLIGMQSTGRRYLCPHCTHCSFEAGITIKPNFAQFVPNQAYSETIKCWICESFINVERCSCISSECRGNVIYPGDAYYEHTSDCCLTCGSPQNR